MLQSLRRGYAKGPPGPAQHSTPCALLASPLTGLVHTAAARSIRKFGGAVPVRMLTRQAVTLSKVDS